LQGQEQLAGACLRVNGERGAEAGPCCGFGGEPDGPASAFRLQGHVVPPWFMKMLSSKFFTPCERHSGHKKNEARARHTCTVPRPTIEVAWSGVLCSCTHIWRQLGVYGGEVAGRPTRALTGVVNAWLPCRSQAPQPLKLGQPGRCRPRLGLRVVPQASGSSHGV